MVVVVLVMVLVVVVVVVVVLVMVNHGKLFRRLQSESPHQCLRVYREKAMGEHVK
jgi:hypothetical protein